MKPIKKVPTKDPKTGKLTLPAVGNHPRNRPPAGIDKKSAGSKASKGYMKNDSFDSLVTDKSIIKLDGMINKGNTRSWYESTSADAKRGATKEIREKAAKAIKGTDQAARAQARRTGV